MKIAITKIGANITFSAHNSSAANADIQYAIKMLNGPDTAFTICTKITRNTVLPKAIPILDIEKVESFNDYDVVLVFNGTINFFGGSPNLGLLSLYRALNKTDKAKICYVQTDGAIFFKELWPYIKDRDWASGFSEKEFEVDGYNVTYLTQGRNLAKMKKAIYESKNSIIPKEIKWIPWERTILTSNVGFAEPPKANNRQYDLGFGGYIRNSYKRKKIEHYYDDPRLKTLLFGNLRGINLNNTKVHSPISYQDMVFTMQKCKSTVVVGDEFYNNNFHTLRMYEGILAGCLVFIDRSFDRSNKFYDGIPEGEDLLVDNTNDVLFYLRSNDINEIASSIRFKIIDSYSKDRLKAITLEAMKS